MNQKYALVLLLSAFLQLSYFTARTQEPRQYLAATLKRYGNWAEVKTVDYTVNGHRDAGAQGKTYKSGERQSYRAKRVYDFPSNKLYETNLNTFPGGYVFHFANAVKDTVAYSYDIDGTRGGKVYNTATRAVAETRMKVIGNHIAYFKVLELFQSPDSLVLYPARDTARYTVIERFNPQKVSIGHYYFSRQTGLLEKVTSRQGTQELALQYSGYGMKNGMLHNREVTLMLNGRNNYEEKIVINRINFVFDDATLAIPAGYTPNKPVPPSQPLLIGKDIYLVERLAGDRNVLFVNMDSFIVVIEAPVSADLSKQVIAKIREVVPNKPIKYVFTTHYHSDHTGGLRQYVHEGAQLIMAAPAQAYVKDVLAAEQPDDLGKSGRKSAEFITVKGKYVLEDQHHRIEFYEVQNTHADGMALAYFPHEKLIYQGDLLSVPLDGTLPYAIQVTKDMQRFLTDKKLVFERMIGHHGHHGITNAMLGQILQRQPPRIK
jgi:glyoxylase-like metal-dependent hydrolase (beta-lactamase superfamily II)